MPERDRELLEGERVTETSVPGVSVTDAGDQILMEETSEREQTPAGELETPQISLDELKALKADLENTRKRMLKEQSRLVEYAGKDLVRNLLPVLDHFQLAIDHGEAGSGVQLAFKELMEVLRVAGLTEIEVEAGIGFDPEVHHALTSVPDPSVDTDTVTQVHRRGYRFKEHVLRAPEVVVAQPVEQIDGEG